MNRAILFNTLIISLFAISASCSSVPNLWPMPQSFESGNETVPFANHCELQYIIHSDVAESSKVYYRNAIDFFEKLQMNEHCKKNHHKGLKNTIHWNKTSQTNGQPSNSIHIEVRNPSTIPVVVGSTDESYNLTVTKDGTSIQAATYSGVVHALMTLNQLVESNENSFMLKSVPIKIRDAPRYSYRGIMVDTSRHFISINTLLKLIDAMALNKLNVFHWHVTDSDSFPIEMPSRPNMTMGAFSPQKIYSSADVKTIIEHAKSRGVSVIPELDTPSHTRSFVEAPEWKGLVTCLKAGYPWAGPPIGMIDVTQEITYKMLGDLYNDLQNNYFSEFGYLHVGADEVFEGCINEIPNITQFLLSHGLKDYKDVFNYFLEKSAPLVANSTTRICWSNSDTLFLKFRETDVLQWWGTSPDLKSAFQQYPKNKFILSNYDYFYMDCGYESVTGAKSWCNYSSWGRIYKFEADDILDQEDYRQRVLGGEIAMWEEISNDFALGTKIWPKGIAFAERFWSAKNNTGNDDLNMFKRLNAQNNRLKALGVAVSPASTGYCEYHPEDCFASA